jgi:lincosamide nucleotidyltransferase A/C/D/E
MFMTNHNVPPKLFDPEVSLSEMHFPAEKVPETLELLTYHDIPAWLDGGWAVDAIAGEQTRDHQDIDLLVPIHEGPRVQQILEGIGFASHEQETELPHRLVMVNTPARLMIDFHLVTPQDDGSMVFKITNYKANVPSYEYKYSPEGLTGRGVIAGKDVSCITLEEQVRCRTTRNYSFDDPDRQRDGGVNADLHDLQLINRLTATD